MNKEEQGLYSDTDLSELHRNVNSLRSGMSKLSDNWLSARLNEEARNYAVHGFLRRASTLIHCIHRIFEVCPPDKVEMDRDALVDTTVYIQSFIFNAYGSVDNLCHILNSQLSLGLHNSQVGFGPGYSKFRSKWNPSFLEKVEVFDQWFQYLSDYRHALGHRIPLYIPPQIVPENVVDQYRTFNRDWHQALIDGNDTLADELDMKMKNLGSFQPFMTHSFMERHAQISFHIQIVEDWKRILELSDLVLMEIVDK